MWETIVSTEASSALNLTYITTKLVATASVENATEYSNSSEGFTTAFPGDLYHPCDPVNPYFNCSVDDFLSANMGGI